MNYNQMLFHIFYNIYYIQLFRSNVLKGKLVFFLTWMLFHHRAESK